jgi:hypothetical protein
MKSWVTQLLTRGKDEHIRKAIGAVRGAEDDPTYFLYFERLAKHLIEMRDKRIKKGA